MLSPLTEITQYSDELQSASALFLFNFSDGSIEWGNVWVRNEAPDCEHPAFMLRKMVIVLGR